MKYIDLGDDVKAIVNKIEGIFKFSPTMLRYKFVQALAFLLNKYKIKKSR